MDGNIDHIYCSRPLQQSKGNFTDLAIWQPVPPRIKKEPFQGDSGKGPHIRPIVYILKYCLYIPISDKKWL